jgi:outer membrane cobalamin receptor
MTKGLGKYVLVLFAIGVFNSSVYSQSDSLSIDDLDVFSMSLEDLLNIEISVASKKGLTQRESPGIVSVINEDEIVSSGAFDLIDILRMVPGISFNSDVQGQVGISMRGNWGFEGKVLVMIDNLTLNENLYGTVLFGNHYDPSQIKRVEIIRGPGSSIYGGYAELGVINIITKKGEDYKGVSATSTFALTANGTETNNVSLGFGNKINDFEWDVKAFLSKGNRSDEVWTDWWEGEGETDGNSMLNAMSVNAGMKYKNLSARVVFDDYKTTTINMYDEVSAVATPVDARSVLSELKYDLKVNDKLTITPSVNYSYYSPWTTLKDPNAVFGTDNSFYIEATRAVGNLLADWSPTDKLNILIGSDYFSETSTNQKPTEGEPYYYNDKDELSFNQVSGYAQLMWQTKIVNMVAGIKVIDHSSFGAASAPRFGLTKTIGNFHAKALFSEAFRSPSFENVNGSTDDNGDPTIKPEVTQVYELELGYKIGKSSLFTVNFFDITIKNPIVYYYDGELDYESYSNYLKAGSMGVEVDYRYKIKRVSASLNYSYQVSNGKNKVSSYQIPGVSDLALGVPKHMVKLNTTVGITKKLDVNLNGQFISERYAIPNVSYDEEDNEILNYEAMPAVFLLNTFVNYKGLIVEGFNLGFGVKNILNEEIVFIQPYANFMAPMPSNLTQFFVRLNYTIK